MNAETLSDEIARWADDPVAFVREVFGVEPDPWQAKVLAAFPSQQRIAMKAAKGCGKSTVEAWLCWNFLLTRPHPKIVATSITGDNLRDNLWTEMAKWQQKSPLLKLMFTWAAERIVCNEHPETWFMSARTWQKGADQTQQANTLAGIHADNVMFILDEAGGIPDAVMAAAEGGLSTGSTKDNKKDSKIAISGNPTHLEGPLYRACTSERHLWWVIEVTGDPDDPARSSRISEQWAREQIEKYGRDNPWVLVNVFGKFPPGQSNALMALDDVVAASKRILGETGYRDEVKILGVDVARFGDDQSVILVRQGRAVFKPRVLRNLDTMQLADQVVMAILEHKPDATFIDVTGIGAGVVDRLNQLGHQVLGIDFGGKATESAKFQNKRVEMWWRAAEWLRAGGCIPDEPEMRSELAAPTYWFDPSGRMCLEAKKEIKARGLPSPDRADALVLTFAMPVAHKGFKNTLQGASHKARTEYDTYREA